MSESVIHSIRAVVRARPGLLAKEILAAIDGCDDQPTVSTLLFKEWKADRMGRWQTPQGYIYAMAGVVPDAVKHGAPQSPAVAPAKTQAPPRKPRPAPVAEKPESLKPIDGPRFLIVHVDGGEVGVFHRESRTGLLLDKETVATIVAASRKS